MHSERLSKALAPAKRGQVEVTRKGVETDAHPRNLLYFSIKPMIDKNKTLFGKENEPDWNKSRRPAQGTDFENIHLPDKYSPRQRQGLGNTSRSPIDKRKTEMEFEDRRITGTQLEPGRSYRILNQFFGSKEREGSNVTDNPSKLTSPSAVITNFTRQNIQKFAFAQPQQQVQQKNTSMISSKSYEILESVKGREGERYQNYQPEELMKNKTLSNFNKILEQTRNLKNNNGNFFMDEEMSARGFTKQKTQLPIHSPNDSFIFRRDCDRSLVNQGLTGSPIQSVIKPRPFDKSKLSALNRSDISKTSNGNNSFLTRRGEDGDLSRVANQQMESNNRGGMSKTWVKSGLLDSREEISTISRKR